MAHAHTPDQPPHTVEEMTKDIDAVEQDGQADDTPFLKPTADGIGPTLGGDLDKPKP